MHDRPRGTAPLSHEDFTLLVDRHQRALHAYLAGMVGHVEQAFDLVQETFVDAWRVARDGAPPFVSGTADDEVRRWLFRVASNNAISLLRRRKLIRWEPLDYLEDTSLEADVGFEEQVAESDALQAALARLAPQDVACLLLRVVHGFSALEAGMILNTSPDNVNNRLARAKQRLRAAYIQQKLSRREAGAHQ